MRIFKYAIGNPTYLWSNTYEICSDNASTVGDISGLPAMATSIALAEAVMHIDEVVYDHAVVASWQPDSHPYNPESFISVALDFDGGHTVAGTPAPRYVVMNVSRLVPFGRAGKLAYRGVFDQDSYNVSDALEPAFTSGAEAALETLVDNFFVAFQGAVETALDEHWSMSMVGMADLGGGPVLVQRPVSGLRIKGVGFNKPNHKYFDRAPTP